MQEVTGSTPVFSTRSARCGQKPYLVQARLFLWTVPILSGAADSGTSGSFAVGYSGFGKRRGNFCRRPYRLKESRKTGSIDLPVDTRLASLCRNQCCVRCRQCFTGAAAWTGRKNKTPDGNRFFHSDESSIHRMNRPCSDQPEPTQQPSGVPRPKGRLRTLARQREEAAGQNERSEVNGCNLRSRLRWLRVTRKKVFDPPVHAEPLVKTLQY